MSDHQDCKAVFAYRFKLNMMAMALIAPFAYALITISEGKKTMLGLRAGLAGTMSPMSCSLALTYLL